MDAPSSQAPQPRRWLGIVLFAAFIPLAVLAFLWFGIPPRVPGEPVRLVRDEDGQLVPEGGDHEKGRVWFEAQAGKIQAQNSMASASVSNHSNQAKFACGRIAIFNRSEHLLMARAGQALLDQLKPIGYLREVNYYPPGSGPEEGQLGPDLTITLDLEKLSESGSALSSNVDAQIVVTMGNAPPGLRHSTVDHLTPPLVGLDWSGRLHHVSTTQGLSSSAAKYKLAAEDIAQQIASALKKELKERREKEGVLPDLPAAFYPSYRKPPELPLGEFGQTERSFAWHGLMNHNETLWFLATDRPAAESLGPLQAQLEKAGWKTQDFTKQPGPCHLRMGRQGAILTAYIPSREPAPAGTEAAGQVLYVHYVDRMTEAERTAAIDEMLRSDVPIETLLMFENHWSTEQSGRALRRLQARPTATPQAALALAGLFHRLKRDEDARRQVLRAQALLRTVGNYGDLETRTRNLAKELGDEKLLAKPIDPRLLDELGFIQLKPGTVVPPREIGLEEPVHFYAKAADGQIHTVSVRAIKSLGPKGEPSYALAHVASSGHGRSWGSGNAAYEFRPGGACSATFILNRLGDAERFRLTTQVSDR